MNYLICTVAAAPLRKEPSHRSEMVSQILFGETMKVMEKKDDWIKIQNQCDGYEGWLTYHLIQPISEKIAISLAEFVAMDLTNPVTLSDQLINAPMGSVLTGLDPETKLLWDENLKYHGRYSANQKKFDEEIFRKLLHSWLNAPYLWGGKTFMGVDCSGFAQVVFKVIGYQLKRDAYQQAEQGSEINLHEAGLGDLAFFKNEEGKITHVGIMLNAKEIIHASGKVRIDSIDKEGITNRDTGKRTHHFYSVKRILNGL